MIFTYIIDSDLDTKAICDLDYTYKMIFEIK